MNFFRQVFQNLIAKDRDERDERDERDGGGIRISVGRDSFYEDAFNKLSRENGNNQFYNCNVLTLIKVISFTIVMFLLFEIFLFSKYFWWVLTLTSL